MKYRPLAAMARQERGRSLKATTRLLPALILTLPLLERQVTIGWFYEARSLEELGTRLGLPVAAIHAALERGISLLRQEMASRSLDALARRVAADSNGLSCDHARPPHQAPSDAAAT
jgi:DNA-directed RNA polymerase specialized sigma24 family protein